MRATLATAFGTIVVLLIGAYVFVIFGLMPANADATPGRLEMWAAKRSLRATLNRDARGLTSPLPPTDSVLTSGVHLYGIYCLVCHGAADGKASAVALGLYQHAPQLAKHDVTDDPIGVTYWKITHGIRLTGMPAFDSTLTDHQRWEIASFLRHQDSLPPSAEAAYKSLPSATDTTRNRP
jgi:mono/diheme cytochrome c family protein